MSSISLPFAQACYNSITLTDFQYQGQGLPALVRSPDWVARGPIAAIGIPLADTQSHPPGSSPLFGRQSVQVVAHLGPDP